MEGCRIQDPGTHGKHQTKNKKFLVYQQGLQGAEFRTLGPMESIKQQHNSTYVLQLIEIDAARHPNVGRCCQQFPIAVRNAKRRHPTSSCPCPPSASAAIQELPSNLPNLPNSAHPSRSSWWQRAACQPPETVVQSWGRAALHGVMELPILLDSFPDRQAGVKGCMCRGAVSRHSGWERRYTQLCTADSPPSPRLGNTPSGVSRRAQTPPLWQELASHWSECRTSYLQH